MKNSTARKLKQVLKGYLVMGVDPHKKRHAAVAVTQDFTALSLLFRYCSRSELVSSPLCPSVMSDSLGEKPSTY